MKKKRRIYENKEVLEDNLKTRSIISIQMGRQQQKLGHLFTV